MRTTRVARKIIKMRLVLVLFAVLGVGATGLWVGENLRAKYARTGADQTEWPQPPNVSIHDLFAANW